MGPSKEDGRYIDTVQELAMGRDETGRNMRRNLICLESENRSRRRAVEATFLFSPDPVAAVRKALEDLKACPSGTGLSMLSPSLAAQVVFLLRGYPSHRAYALALEVLRDRTLPVDARVRGLYAAVDIANWPLRFHACAGSDKDCYRWGLGSDPEEMSVPGIAVDNPVRGDELAQLVKDALVAALSSESAFVRNAGRNIVEWNQNERHLSAIELMARDPSLPEEVRKSAMRGWAFTVATKDAFAIRGSNRFPGDQIVPTHEGVYRVSAATGEKVLVQPVPTLEVDITRSTTAGAPAIRKQ
jgi:hypothetical protein